MSAAVAAVRAHCPHETHLISGGAICQRCVTLSLFPLWPGLPAPLAARTEGQKVYNRVARNARPRARARLQFGARV